MPNSEREVDLSLLQDDYLDPLKQRSLNELSNIDTTSHNLTRWMKFKIGATYIYKNYVLEHLGESLLILSQFFNSIMVFSCKLLVTDKNGNSEIQPLQILFVRMAITYLCCMIFMLVTRSVPDAPFGPRSLRKLMFLRGVVGFIGVFGMYFSLQYISLSDAVAITFLTPIVTAFFAWIFLHERYSILEGVCSIISLIGVLLIAKPSFLFGQTSENETSNDESVESASTEKRLLATAAGCMGVVGASLVFIVLRKIGKQAHPLLTVSYFSLICCVISLSTILIVPSMKFEFPQNNYQWFLLSLIGFSGFIMQFLLTAGVQRVKAGKASLMGYTGMVFAIFWDLVLWHHFPGFLSVLGIVIIITNAILVIRCKSAQPEGEIDIEQNYASAKSSDIPLDEFTIESETEDD